MNERCAGGACDDPSDNATCCPDGEGWMKAVAGAFPCTTAPQATDCDQGWTCCAGRCRPGSDPCVPCDSDTQCGAGQPTDIENRALTAWAYAMPDRCGFIQDAPCPEGFIACEGRNSDTFDLGDDAPGWVCCPRGSTCIRERGVCVQE